jgi:hypothetical protein
MTIKEYKETAYFGLDKDKAEAFARNAFESPGETDELVLDYYVRDLMADVISEALYDWASANDLLPS